MITELLPKTEEAKKHADSIRAEFMERIGAVDRIIAQQIEKLHKAEESEKETFGKKDLIAYQNAVIEEREAKQAILDFKREKERIENAPRLSESDYITFKASAMEELQSVVDNNKAVLGDLLSQIFQAVQETRDCIHYVNGIIAEAYKDFKPKTDRLSDLRYQMMIENELFNDFSICALGTWIQRSKLVPGMIAAHDREMVKERDLNGKEKGNDQ